MEKEQLEKLQYPIGRFALPMAPGPLQIEKSIARITAFPELLRKEVGSLDNQQLDTVYRPGGWTVRQVIHHVADSHMNGYIRFKWGLTEDLPHIKTYREELWAILPDVMGAPVAISLNLLDALHEKWGWTLKSLNPEQWQRSIFHPGLGKEVTLSQLVCQYAWHCNHHLAHITGLKDRENWE